jgi:hypothetical protein
MANCFWGFNRQKGSGCCGARVGFDKLFISEQLVGAGMFHQSLLNRFHFGVSHDQLTQSSCFYCQDGEEENRQESRRNDYAKENYDGNEELQTWQGQESGWE